MANAVKMPQIGQDIQTGRIVEWAVAENQPVSKGDLIVSVESDKALFEVEAPVAGVMLKILKQNGQEADVFSTIGFIGEIGEILQEQDGKTRRQGEGETEREGDKETGRQGDGETEREGDKETGRQGEGETNPPQQPPDRLFASPAARRRARAEGVDLAGISGSGPGGRVIVRDLPLLRRSDFQVGHCFCPGRHRAGKAMSDLEVGPTQPCADEQLFSPMRRTIAQRMVLSKQSIPHFYLFRDVDCTAAAAWRSGQNEGTDARITWSDIIIRATALALLKFNRLNAHVKDDRLIIKSEVNIGLAVALEDGLLVPVLPKADRLGIREIGTISRQLIEAARRGVDKTIVPSTFTISNLGTCDVDRFIPIINPPECGILGVGSIQKRAVTLGDGIAVRDMVTLCLACDHRAVDGAYAAAFLNSIKMRIENPDQLEANRSESPDFRL